jgi:hypothetical protein
MIGVNPITAKNNTIVTLHLDNEEHDSERFAPYGELHGDDTTGFHWVAPHAIKRQFGPHELVILPPSFMKTEHDNKFTTVPLSMSILENGFPSMGPRTYNGFKCRLDSSSFSNKTSFGLRHI